MNIELTLKVHPEPTRDAAWSAAATGVGFYTHWSDTGAFAGFSFIGPSARIGGLVESLTEACERVASAEVKPVGTKIETVGEVLAANLAHFRKHISGLAG